MFRLSFNTGFIPASNLFHCGREMVSPEDAHKDYTKLPADFNIYLSFQDYCKGWEGAPPCRNNETELDDLCKRCSNLMNDEINNWK